MQVFSFDTIYYLCEKRERKKKNKFEKDNTEINVNITDAKNAVALIILFIVHFQETIFDEWHGHSVQRAHQQNDAL